MYIHIHMATKTISITDEAYTILKSWKTGGESFSDVITKIGKRHRLSAFAGTLSEKEGKALEESIASSRRLSRRRIARL